MSNAKRVAFLGPAGAYGEEAAHRYAPDAQHIPYPSNQHVAASVEDGEADEAVVPIENSLYGSVTDVLDALVEAKRTKIRGELLLPVRHCLIVHPGRQIEDIVKVLSHPQALGQCRRYLAGNLPDAIQEATASTAGAVEAVSRGDDTLAAIASGRAAEIYGLEVLEEGIQDSDVNITRFAVLANEDHPATGDDKTSVAFDFHTDAPGLVYSALRPFAERNINLTKIESRPTGSELGRYIFILDFQGHRTDPHVVETLDEIRPHMAVLKVLGSYPRAYLDA